jgi:DNA (cytosine-5)-methyltransferase 1
MTIRVAELFAGVGGFRIGLERANKKTRKTSGFKVVWSNQWEPGEKAQYASRVYEARFGAKGHSNEDISTVDPRDVARFDLLVGGFPCQDYSVAKPLNQASGLEGKKGVLWWDIHRFIAARKPRMALLENVDRLLVSPSGQRGRDFAIMLATLNDLGYAVEWRVINAAEYGFHQRRRRVFIVAHRKGTEGHRRIKESMHGALLAKGLIAVAFPAEPATLVPECFEIRGESWEVSSGFNAGAGQSPFLNAGVALNRQVMTQKLLPRYRGRIRTLGEILEDEAKVPEDFFITKTELGKWKEHKGAKRVPRTKKNGVTYEYAEGAVAFPEPLDKPSRTIITSEGGRSASRFKHVVLTPSGRHRRLTPVELEKLSGFPKNHTRLEGVSDARRAFFIGNALVTGIIEKFGAAILRHGFLED